MGCAPKPKDDKISHKHLGFTLDSKLCGSSHIAKMRGTYMSELSKVEEVYKVMGESMALLYLSSTAGPKTLFGSEAVPDTEDKLFHTLNRWWSDLVSKAVGVSSTNDILSA